MMGSNNIFVCRECGTEYMFGDDAIKCRDSHRHERCDQSNTEYIGLHLDNFYGCDTPSTLKVKEICKECGHSENVVVDFCSLSQEILKKIFKEIK